MTNRLLLTGFLLLLAVLAVFLKYEHYLTNPWTRDGQVRARVVEVTPRVTAPIIAIHVTDNSEVNVGDLLFEIDPRTYLAAQAKTKANVAQADANLQEAIDEAHRGHSLSQRDPGAISQLILTQQANAVKSAEAGLSVAQADYDEANLNVDFTQIRATVDGFISNLDVLIGSQAVANQPLVALIDKHSFWIEGFFKETDIEDVAAGDHATVTLMTYSDQPLTARVESIGYGIARENGSTGESLLPNVTATFPWIRLAQRIPVRITLDKLPENIQLRVGTTVSVMIHKQANIHKQKITNKQTAIDSPASKPR